MVQEIHILNKSGKLTPFESLIKKACNSLLEKINETIELPAVDIVIVDSPKSAIPETGVGGNAYTPHFVMISINPEFPGLADTLEKEIKSTLAHELHHCGRMNAVSAYSTLLGACVTEGLADHFDIEMNGTVPRPWSTAVQGEDLERLIERATQEFNSDSYDYFGWFFGSAAAGLPRWGGYSIGFEIVRRYLEKTGKRASELVSIRSEDFSR